MSKLGILKIVQLLTASHNAAIKTRRQCWFNRNRGPEHQNPDIVLNAAIYGYYPGLSAIFPHVTASVTKL
jgi:hypothetical protein